MSGEQDECFDLFKGIYDAQQQMIEMGVEPNKVYLNGIHYYVKPIPYGMIYGMEVEVVTLPKWIRFVVTHDDGNDGCQRYCDRNICYRNEVNGVGCDECEVTKGEQNG